jgi:SAM-dependent methyltransferase
MLLERSYDRLTVGLLDELLPARCAGTALELGAGRGSIARALADRGYTVTAVDLETAPLMAAPYPGVTPRRLDLTRSVPPSGPFDLIHSRLLLEHLPNREKLIRALAARLDPGAVMLIEDLVLSVTSGADDTPAADMAHAIAELARCNGWEPEFGRRLPSALRAAGLDHVRARGLFGVHLGRTTTTAFASTVTGLADDLIKRGIRTGDAVRDALAWMRHPDNTVITPGLVQAWGWKTTTSPRAITLTTKRGARSNACAPSDHLCRRRSQL